METYYHFFEGTTHYYRNTDEGLRSVRSPLCLWLLKSSRLYIAQSLDRLLTKHLSEKIAVRLPQTTTLFQAAQIITNVEHFIVACAELEEQLTKLRCAPD